MRVISGLIFISGFLGILALGGCKSAGVSVCQEKLPQFRTRLELALSRLGHNGRAPASSYVINNDERDYWVHWAEKELKETQYYLDMTERDPALHSLSRSLSDASVWMVSLRGYAEKRDSAKMAKLLVKIRESTVPAGQKACSSAGL